jgi:Uma2 family endonuclease
MTVNELLALPQDEWMYELVEGSLVRMPASGGAASRIAVRLASALNQFVEPGDLGAVTGADGEYDLTQPGDAQETALAPDAAFVRADRVPPRNSPEYDKAWRLAPDLVAEVVSPNQYRPEMAEKAKRYLAAGVRLVWIIWPKYQQVEVWRQGDVQASTTLGVGDQLDGLDVLPGFTYPVGRLLG